MHWRSLRSSFLRIRRQMMVLRGSSWNAGWRTWNESDPGLRRRRWKLGSWLPDFEGSWMMRRDERIRIHLSGAGNGRLLRSNYECNGFICNYGLLWEMCSIWCTGDLSTYHPSVMYLAMKYTFAALTRISSHVVYVFLACWWWVNYCLNSAEEAPLNKVWRGLVYVDQNFLLKTIRFGYLYCWDFCFS